MSDKPVCLIAFEDQDNLGVGYLASVLLKAGFNVKILDFCLGKERILEKIKLYNPLVVGFSIIFQYHIDGFKELIDYLRTSKIVCHFSAGGHYPSLRYDELLKFVPQLDSVVLFEGEHTFLELVKTVYAGGNWKNIEGIAYREKGLIVANRLRPLENDLDFFPIPVRQPLKEFAFGKKYATILAGRGCVYDCSFCSIREFYSKPAGLLKRVRRPEMVAGEMDLLQKQKDCSVFMFQDDDFPVAKSGGQWVRDFCNILVQKGLSKKILWKINCRPDEVESNTFEMMRKCGLFLVYLGIETGTDEGLRLMNKRITVETNLKAVKTLKALKIKFDFGFMLFDPSTTYKSILDNLNFLEIVCGDGSSPITFCKMLPYAGTKIESELRKEGRLKGNNGFYDYDFLDFSINHLYSFMVDCFEDWIMKRDGLLNASRWLRYCLAVYEKHFSKNSMFEDLNMAASEIISQSNQYFINRVRKLVSIYSLQDYAKQKEVLSIIKDDIAIHHSEYILKLNKIFEKLKNMSP